MTVEQETTRKRGAANTVMRIGKRLILSLGKVGFSLLAAWLASGPLIDAAARERGYTGAYGGEWMLIFAVFVLAYYLSTKAVNAAFYPKPKTNQSKI